MTLSDGMSIYAASSGIGRPVSFSLAFIYETAVSGVEALVAGRVQTILRAVAGKHSPGVPGVEHAGSFLYGRANTEGKNNKKGNRYFGRSINFVSYVFTDRFYEETENENVRSGG